MFEYVSSYQKLYKFHANIRIDLKQPDNIEYHSNQSSWENSIYHHPPNPSLGFQDSNSGSDVLSVIEKFLENTQVPVCGAVIHISLKRYPNETDIDRLVARIRQHLAIVTVVISNSPSGGLYSHTMYNLATKTNGLGAFASDEGSEWAENEMNSFYQQPYYIYSVNVNVSQSGFVTLPDMFLPAQAWYYIDVTVQDSGILSTFRGMSWNFTSPTDSHSFTFKFWQFNKKVNQSSFIDDDFHLNNGNYKVTLDYAYADSREQTLQLRVVIFDTYIDYWIPYAD